MATLYEFRSLAEVAAGLRKASRDCSGYEPSLSMLQIAAEDAAAFIDKHNAELPLKQKLIVAPCVKCGGIGALIPREPKAE